MHIKTLLQTLNATEKIDEADPNAKYFKRDVQRFILNQADKLFPSLEIIYNPGGKWSSKLKTNPQ